MLYPEGTKVIVKPDTTEELTAGGIILPETVRHKEQTAVTRGKIIAIGPLANVTFINKEGIKRDAKEGDNVIFAQWGGAVIMEDQEDGKRQELRILQDEDIVCLIK